jgi:hypothetical protein
MKIKRFFESDSHFLQRSNEEYFKLITSDEYAEWYVKPKSTWRSSEIQKIVDQLKESFPNPDLDKLKVTLEVFSSPHFGGIPILSTGDPHKPSKMAKWSFLKPKTEVAAFIVNQKQIDKFDKWPVALIDIKIDVIYDKEITLLPSYIRKKIRISKLEDEWFLIHLTREQFRRGVRIYLNKYEYRWLADQFEGLSKWLEDTNWLI